MIFCNDKKIKIFYFSAQTEFVPWKTLSVTVKFNQQRRLLRFGCNHIVMVMEKLNENLNWTRLECGERKSMSIEWIRRQLHVFTYSWWWSENKTAGELSEKEREGATLNAILAYLTYHTHHPVLTLYTDRIHHSWADSENRVSSHASPIVELFVLRLSLSLSLSLSLYWLFKIGIVFRGVVRVYYSLG